MHDLFIIILYEFYDYIKPLLYLIFSYYIFKIKLWFLIPKKTKVDLKKVIIVYKSKIIFYNYLNINYYHLKFFTDKEYLTVKGNTKYILFNHNKIYKLNSTKLLLNINNFSIYYTPIKLYPQEECCVCYNYPGTINGLCGHQNICSECASKLNKCAFCNLNFIENSLYLKKILYVI